MKQKTNRVIREESGRTAVWLFFSLLGWSLVLNSTPEIDLSLPTFFGVVLASAVGMSLVVVGVRLLTGQELKGGTESKDLMLLTTTFLIGFYLMWSYLSANWSMLTSLLVIVLVLTIAVRIARPSTFGISSAGR